MDIDSLAFQLIIEMRKTPLATLSDLADRLGVASNTVKSRKQYLRDNGIIRDFGDKNDPLLGSREISDVVAHHSPTKLGLQRIHVVLEQIYNIEEVSTIVSNHPYTYYQSVGMGHHRMLYAIFDIPPNCFQLLVEFLDRMRSHDLYHNYFLIEADFQANSHDDLKIWKENPNWDISLNTHLNGTISIKEAFETNLKSKINLKTIIKPHETPALDDLDLKLLRELTINSKVSPTALAQIYDRDRTTLSRRLNKIRDNYIENYSLIYNRKIFNLDSTFLLYGRIDSIYNNGLFQLIDRGFLPYMSNYYSEKRGNFIWHIFAPPTFCNEVLHTLLSSKTDIHLALLNPKQAIRYYFYPDNYDTEKNEWRDDREYFLEVLNDDMKATYGK